MSTPDILHSGRALIRQGWCQGADARDQTGKEVPPWSSAARSWSILGALVGSHGVGRLTIGALPIAELGAAIAALGEAADTHSLQAWNDAPERTQDQALAAFDRALDHVRPAPAAQGSRVRRSA